MTAKPLSYLTLTKRQTERQLVTAVWRNGGFSASYDSFVVGSSAVLRLNFCAINPPLRQAAKTLAAIFNQNYHINENNNFIILFFMLFAFYKLRTKAICNKKDPDNRHAFACALVG